MSDKPIISVILAAGRGVRMGEVRLPKVCAPIHGIPAILRALDSLDRAGIRRHLIVVGHRATEVVQIIGENRPDVIYAFQRDLLGTGHAARTGCRVLQNLGYEGRILILAGDKAIRPGLIERLLCTHREKQADFSFVVGRRERWPTSGRILRRKEGSVLANVEVLDIRYAQTVRSIHQWKRTHPDESLSGIRLREIMEENIRRPDKIRTLFPLLSETWNEETVPETLLEAECPERDSVIRIPGQAAIEETFTPEEADRVPEVNLSVYLGEAKTLYRALASIQPSPVTGEEYLTDIIHFLGTNLHPSSLPYQIVTCAVEDDNEVLGFNTREELNFIESVWGTREGGTPQPLPSPPVLRPVSEWMRAFEEARAGRGDLARHLAESYCREPRELEGITGGFLDLLQRATERFHSETPVALLRAPGRINLFGRHIDHQGGNNNFLVIPREVRMVLRPRQDDRFNLLNLDANRFPEQRFSIRSEIAGLTWTHWQAVLESLPHEKIAHRTLSDWDFYFQAAALRLQEIFRERELCGFDAVAQGDIPIGAGLSSSSALVVAAAKAIVAFNGLPLDSQNLVEICGEAEHFVGTRGGAGDHAAILLSEPWTVTQVSFFPFEVVKQVGFPKDLALAVCHSGIEARKAVGARDQFNARVAAYRISRLLLRNFFPQHAERIAHLRDVNPRKLGIPAADIYRMLRSLPLRATREQVYQSLDAPADREELAAVFAAHREPEDGYPVRSVALYGLAECERSRMCPEHLESRRAADLGQMMRVSHSAEAPNPPGPGQPGGCDDEAMSALIRDAERSNAEARRRAELWRQPGWYGCSTPEIEKMVRLVQSTAGVHGEQLSGAGLGGCIMVLCQQEAFEEVRQKLIRDYYSPVGLEADVTRAVPIRGCEFLP